MINSISNYNKESTMSCCAAAVGATCIITALITVLVIGILGTKGIIPMPQRHAFLLVKIGVFVNGLLIIEILSRLCLHILVYLIDGVHRCTVNVYRKLA